MIILCLEPGTMEFKYEKDRIYLVNQGKPSRRMYCWSNFSPNIRKWS